MRRAALIAASFSSALSVPAVALAAAPRTFSELADLVVTLLDSAAGILVVAGIVIYFYGVSTNILKMRDESGQKVRAYMVWGLIVIFVMVSIWGIIGLLQNTLFGGDRYSPSTGQSGAAPAFRAPIFAE